MNPVFTLGERVIGQPVGLATVIPPSPQPPPGGGRPPGAKYKQKHNGALRSIPKLIGLYTPNNLTFGTGNEVDTWIDSSGYHRDAAPDGSPGNRLIQRYDPIIRSAYVEGNGSREGNAFNMGGTFLPDPQHYSVYAVVKWDGSSDFIFWSLSESTGDTTLRLGINTTGHFKVDSTFAGSAVTANPITAGWHYLVYLKTGSNSSKLYINGKNFPLATLPSMVSPSIFHVGSGWYQVFGGYPRMVGSIAELGWWGRAINQNERLTIEGHAKYKFQL